MAESLPPGVWAHLAARVQAVSRRPRMALLVALLLVERADERGVVHTSRTDLAHALRGLVGQRGYQARRVARQARISPLLEERRMVEAHAHEVIGHAPLAGIEAAIGDPTGQNISHVMSELGEAGVIVSRAYIDTEGRLHDKPARGRIYVLQLTDWLHQTAPP